MGLSHNRLGLSGAGWARQQNNVVLPAATAMAGVDMRLSPNAYRELHWHSANEWSYIMNGSVRVQAVNENGQTFIDDLDAGDVWFFPAGVPHSIQALDQGVEFLLVFDEGSFSEEDTNLASELFLRNPTAVLAKDLKTDVSAFYAISTGELYIFPGTPAPANISEQNVTGPAGALPAAQSYSYHLSQQAPYVVPGGSIKILDPSTFPIASMFSVALVTVAPGAMRELHWHLNSDEWDFFLKGSARITVFAAPESSRTFDFQAGDVAYVPVPQSHYIENTGDEDVMYLEVLQAPKFTGELHHMPLASEKRNGLLTATRRYLRGAVAGPDAAAGRQGHAASTGRDHCQLAEVQAVSRTREYERYGDELHCDWVMGVDRELRGPGDLSSIDL